MQHSATQWNAVQHSATQCNTLQRSPTQCNTVQHSATQCNTVQHSATQCNTLQDSATQCNILQHSATGAHDMMCATSTDELRQHARQKWREIFLRRECNNMRTWIETCEWVNETLCGSMRLNQSDTCTYICGSYTYEFWKQIRMNILIWKETCEWVNETLFDIEGCYKSLLKMHMCKCRRYTCTICRIDRRKRDLWISQWDSLRQT